MATAKGIEGLDCEADALDGIRLSLRARLDEMYELRGTALNWDDIEGVHDMRVASRRLRSALRDFRDFVDAKGGAQRRLRTVAAALGSVRDEDVAIAGLEKLRAKAKPEVASGIDQLVGERKARRDKARSLLESMIADTMLAGLQETFMARLEKAASGAGGKKDGTRTRRAASLSFRQAGREVIASRWGELLDLSDSLHRPFEAEPIHQMRIAAKRLRYAMELFAPCWESRLTPFAREVAELQTSLGELRDCDVWITDLGAKLDLQYHRLRSKGDTDATPHAQSLELRHASVWLLQHFTKERGRHFRRALDRWHKWETKGFSSRLMATLEEVPTAKASAHATNEGASDVSPAVNSPASAESSEVQQVTHEVAS